MNVVAIAVAVVALLHHTFFNRVIGHAADAMGQQVTVFIALDLVASDAFKVSAIRSHVHIEITRRVGQRHRQVAMLDVVAATRIGVAEDAVIDRWAAAILGNALCNQLQVNSACRPSGRCRCFGIGTCLVMTYQAVDVVAITEIVARIRVVITNMTLRTATFIRRDCDTEVIQNVLLAVDTAFESLNVRGDAFPIEMPGSNNLVADTAVTAHARFGAFIRVFGKVACVQSRRFVGITTSRATVVDVNDAITVDVFVREIFCAVLVEIPAGDAIRTIRASGSVRTVSSCDARGSGSAVGAIITLASGQPKADQQGEQCEHRW